ncbi:hypothetical protein [Sphaerisporangium krabiense]|uniref:Uncharacterized protein n=1 Tax=Sphaerisporangium krabiense TaxID=763782 RepID=A0A7W8Z693_9ACTN|nr:hypothetical protein [Sphaerisporangium krabiense]MBB5628276.1 hypothetical protein [Sphaerisporangium krabiense]
MRRSLPVALACLALVTSCSGGGLPAEGSSAPRPPMATTPSASPTPTPTPTLSPSLPPSEWRLTDDVRLEWASALLGVAATGPRDVWAVGYQRSAEDREGAPALVHWDGARWTESAVASEDTWHLVGVSAAGPRDVWIVGNADSPYAARWDGTRWHGSQPFGVAEDYFLTGVSTGPAGAWFTARNGTQGQILRWTGTRFRTALRADGVFTALTTAPGHVWAVGSNAPGASGRISEETPMIWHGTAVSGTEVRSWERAQVPKITGGYLQAVAAVTPSDVWAVGKVVAEDGGGETPLLLHFDGSSWRHVDVPVSRGQLLDVTAYGPRDVWIGGVDASLPERPLFLHFDGRAWTPSYGPALRERREDQQYEKSDHIRRVALARVPGSSRLWAVGSVGEGDDEDDFVLTRG